MSAHGNSPIAISGRADGWRSRLTRCHSTASLAIENAICDVHDKGLQVYIVGASEKIQRRLQKLGLFDRVTPEHILSDRTEALRQAVDLVYSKEVIA